MADWQPYNFPDLEEPDIPLHDLTEWLASLPGHPQPLTPHHTAAGTNHPSLWWSKGQPGRGLVHPNGTVYTWPEEEMTHQQRAYAMGIPHDYDRGFAITPDAKFRMNGLSEELLPTVQEQTGLQPHPYYYPQFRTAATDEVCPQCDAVHAEGEQCPMLYGQDFTMPPPPGGEKTSDSIPPNGTHACPGCGQGTISNGWTGWTSVTNGEYGPRSWNCPSCGLDHRDPLGRPELQSGQSRY